MKNIKDIPQNSIKLEYKDYFSPLIEVCLIINNLKQMYRRGWLRNQIPSSSCESIADHIFGVTFLTMLLTDHYRLNLDFGKLLRMALIHDIGEIFAGDITPEDKISEEQKRAMEKAAITKIFSPLSLEMKYLNIWEEYEKRESPEAKFVHQIDKIEMAIQAFIYEKTEMINLEDFFQSSQLHISNPVLKNFFMSLEKHRKGMN